MFAGPNGSGKSTIIKELLSKNDVIYLNADYCARVDPEIAKMHTGLEKSVRAQKETERQIKEMISSGESFAWETVFSHESRFEMMKSAKLAGYRIHLNYITTKHPNINVRRVHDRFLRGGHDVLEEKIRERYKRSVSFLPDMILAADEVLIYDNSYDNANPTLLFQKLVGNNDDSRPNMIVWQVDDDEVTEWVMAHVIKPLNGRGIFVDCFKSSVIPKNV
jgi:predicted ABC-type ATPase